jgi:site-specific DNA-cytosine methylase
MLAWARDVKRHADIIVHENVFGYRGGVLLDVLGDDFVTTWKAFSPSDLGFPANRPRVYMIATRKATISRHPPDMTEEDLFEKLFFRQLCLPGTVYFVASGEEVRAMKRNLLQRSLGSLGLSREAGADVVDALPWEALLGPGNGLRLSEYRDAAQAHDYDKEKCMANVAQNEDFFSTTAFVPTLLKSSLVFCLSPGINRLMTPLECFTVMGMDAHKQGKFLCHLDAFFKAQRGTSPTDMRCLAGNSMHMAAVGAVLMYALSTAHMKS